VSTPHPLAIARRQVDGATLLVIEDHSLPIVRFVVTLCPGTLADPVGQSGLTRTLMELTLRGTEARDRYVFNAALEELGSHLSSAASMEIALYRGISLKRHLPQTLALLSEAMATPALAPDEIEGLLEEMIEGLKGDRDDDDTVAELFLRKALYRNTLLARSPQGEVPELARLTRDALKQAHQSRFVKSGLVLALAGDITPDEATALTRELLAPLPTEAAIPKLVPTRPESAPLEILVVDKPERTQVQLRVGLHGLPGHHPDVMALWLGSMAFGGTFTSPLTHEVRDVRGWSYTAHAGFDRLSRLPAPMVLRTAPASHDAVACLALELELLQGLGERGLGPETIDFARSYVLNRYPLEIATATDLLMGALRYELLGRPPEAVFEVPALVSAQSVGQVNQVLAAHLGQAHRTVVMVGTASELLGPLKERFPTAKVASVDFREGLGL